MIIVTYKGLPVEKFPTRDVDPDKQVQTIFVDFIIYKNVYYASGAYVKLGRTRIDAEPVETTWFSILDVALKPHLLK